MAQQKLINLSTQCTNIFTAHGQRVINSLIRHNLPKPLKQWPDIVPITARSSNGDPVSIAPLDLAEFPAPPPSDFDEGSFGSLEEQEALDTLTAQLYDTEAGNFAKYHS